MRIAFIGLGEAASAIITGWGAERAGAIKAFDIKSLNPVTKTEIDKRAARLEIEATGSAAEALAGAELVFSVVTADQALTAAETSARDLEPGALWCDLNSCSPGTKTKASAFIGAAGGRYLDVAVMAPVYPMLNMVPCLISGPDASTAHRTLERLPMTVTTIGTDIGRASSIKMVRSIMVKGLEALTAECTLAAAAAGVADEVFPSLKSGHPHIDLPERAAYNFERSLVHGARRAAEMDEVAKMLAELGLPNAMAKATADWQRTLGSTDLALPEGEAPDHHWFAQSYLRLFGLDEHV